MDIKIKKTHRLAQIPSKAHESDAGFDLVAADKRYSSDDETGLYTEYRSGLSLEIPKGYVGLVFPRSSVSETRHTLRNSVGVIDSGYRGEIKLRFSPDDTHRGYQIGDRIGQIVFMRLPSVKFVEVSNLDKSERGEGGFGSSNE